MDLELQSFSSNILNRSDERRKDEKFLFECLENQSNPSIMVLAVKSKHTRKILTRRQENVYSVVYYSIQDVLNITSSDNVSDLLKYSCVLLGHDDNTRAWHISMSLPEEFGNIIINYITQHYDQPNITFRLEDGLSLLVKLSIPELALAGLVLAMASWHDNNTYDSRTGKLTEPAECGAKRKVVGSVGGSIPKLYPRIDPVMIACVVSPDGQHCLLGSMKKMPTNFYSCLSGFIEPCESVAEAVRREVWEESGIKVGKVELLSSQPWPIGKGGGCELMIGCYAYALTTDIHIQDSEVESVRWFTHNETKAMLEESMTRKEFKPSATSYIPGPYALAHHLIKQYIDRTTTTNKMTPSSSFKESSSKLLYTWATRIGWIGVGVFLSYGIYNQRYLTLELIQPIGVQDIPTVNA